MDRPVASNGRVLHRLILLVAGLTAGCSGPDYVPDITLTEVRPIIDATAEFHDLYPAPALVSGKESFGLDAPKAKRIEPSALTEQVESELVDAFSRAGVFSRVTRFDPHPDVILTGRINALHEHYRPQIWTKIPNVGWIAQILSVKTHVSSGEADLTVFVLRPNGDVVGKYTGSSSFKESFNPTGAVPPGARLNRALSEAVKEIQEKLIRDGHLRKLASR